MLVRKAMGVGLLTRPEVLEAQTSEAATDNGEGLMDHSPILPMGTGIVIEGYESFRRRRYRKRPPTEGPEMQRRE